MLLSRHRGVRSSTAVGCALSLMLLAASCSSRPARSPGGYDPFHPEREPSTTVERASKRIGDAQACGEAVQGLDDDTCKMQPVFECLEAALTACRAAHGLHLYTTPEGDPVRVDYFVEPKDGRCFLLVIDDATADPVGPKEVVERQCGSVSWQPQPGKPDCQSLSPDDCRTLSSTPRESRVPE